MPSQMNSTPKQMEEKGSLKAWIYASRPQTLSISIVPLIVGTVLASRQVEHLNWLLLISIFLCVPWIQVGMNFINDALDFKRGGKNVEKLSLQRAGLLSPRQFLLGGYTCFALALVFGLPLVIVGGLPFALLLFLSITLGYLYTGGPFPLSYTGTSDPFILIFYGWVSTTAAYYLQTDKIDAQSILAGTQIGLLAIVPHAINNLRDCIADAFVGKKTLAVRFGSSFARWEISICSFLPFFLGLLWMKEGSFWMGVLPVLSMPFVMRNIRSIWEEEPGSQYNQFIVKSALSQLVFSFLMVMGALLT